MILRTQDAPGGDPNAEYLSDGITESLINSLSMLPHLKVMSRDSAFMYKGKETDTRKVGETLGVRAVLKGRVMQSGNDLEISAELVDARDDSHIWGQQYSRKATDIFGLQGDLAKEMTSMLRMRLTGDDEKQMMKSYTANPQAYQLYLQGRFWLNKRNEEGTRKAIEFFQQASEKDPTYALAYSGLADSYATPAGFGTAAPKEAYPKARDAALKALAIDDALAEAHASLGFVKTMYYWDLPGAEREFQRSIELNPSYASAHLWYDLALVSTGRVEEAMAQSKRALELDPVSTISNWNAGFIFYLARRYDQAIDQERKTLELDPNFLPAHGLLGEIYGQKSMYTEAVTEFKKGLAASPGDGYALGGLGYAYAKAGRKAEAEKLLNQLNELSKQKYVPALSRTEIYAGLGEKQEAIEWLEKAFVERSARLGVSIKNDPIFDPLRSDPRFQDLLRRMNLQQ